MKLEGGNINIISGVAFKDGMPRPLVKLDLTVDDRMLAIWLEPHVARKVGLDLIGAAHSAVADSMLRGVAKQVGVDGDAMIDHFRKLTDAALPDYFHD